MYLSKHAVMLVAVFLHKSPYPPYQRGFFCNDDSIKLPYKNSTVSTTALTAVGVTVPVVSVSLGVVKQENEKACRDTLSPLVVGWWYLKRYDWFNGMHTRYLIGFVSLTVNHVYCPLNPVIVHSILPLAFQISVLQAAL